MRGIATHTQVVCHSFPSYSMRFLLFKSLLHCSHSNIYLPLQAMHAQSSVAVGMKGAGKAMAAINKVRLVN